MNENKRKAIMIATYSESRDNYDVYLDKKGDKYIVKNRQYIESGKPHKYLFKKEKDNKPKYISGLFPTKDKGVYSGDTFDKITGTKNLFYADLTDKNLLKITEKDI